MKSSIFVYTGMVILLFFGSCKEEGAPGTTDIAGTYSYMGYDTNGVQISNGSLLLTRNGSQLSGVLKILGSLNVDSVGGTITGSDSIDLNLNPHKATNYLVFLRGVITNGTIRGDINSYLYDPPIGGRTGRFVAIRAEIDRVL